MQQTLCFSYRESKEILYSQESILVKSSFADETQLTEFHLKLCLCKVLQKVIFFGRDTGEGENASCRPFCTLQLFCYSLRDLLSFLPSPYHRELCTCHRDGGICKDSLHTVSWRHWCLFIPQGPDIVEMSALLRGRPS